MAEEWKMYLPDAEAGCVLLLHLGSSPERLRETAADLEQTAAWVDASKNLEMPKMARMAVESLRLEMPQFEAHAALDSIDEIARRADRIPALEFTGEPFDPALPQPLTAGEAEEIVGEAVFCDRTEQIVYAGGETAFMARIGGGRLSGAGFPAYAGCALNAQRFGNVLLSIAGRLEQEETRRPRAAQEEGEEEDMETEYFLYLPNAVYPDEDGGLVQLGTAEDAAAGVRAAEEIMAWRDGRMAEALDGAPEEIRRALQEIPMRRFGGIAISWQNLDAAKNMRLSSTNAPFDPEAPQLLTEREALDLFHAGSLDCRGTADCRLSGGDLNFELAKPSSDEESGVSCSISIEELKGVCAPLLEEAEEASLSPS